MDRDRVCLESWNLLEPTNAWMVGKNRVQLVPESVMVAAFPGPLILSRALSALLLTVLFAKDKESWARPVT